jgi:hypothetical protein
MRQAFDVFASGVAHSFADYCNGFYRRQEYFRFEKRIVRRTVGNLPEQIEKPLAKEDGLLSGDFFYFGGCEAAGIKANFIFDVISQQDFRAHITSSYTARLL